MKLTGSFVSVASLISGDLVVFVRFNLVFRLFRVLVCILINVTTFLLNERLFTFLTVKKTMPIFGKNKACMQIQVALYSFFAARGIGTNGASA